MNALVAPSPGVIADAAAAARYIMAEPADIDPSKTNPRKSFTKIEELADSATKHGIINPLLVRPHPAAATKGPKYSGPAYELVAGERRLRAAKLAKLVVVPILVRDLSDKEVLEIQVIENLQRADVHPLEEADGYKLLIDEHGYDVEQLAAKIGKSKAYVYARMKLTALGPVPRKAFLEEKLNPSIALMIARIPDAKLQAEATNEVLGRGEWDAYQESGIEQENVRGEDHKREDMPLSVRAAQIHLQRKYMLRLDQATFDLADATLVPKAGACAPCPKRTGNQRELFADVKSADVCTDPKCFESKKKADWDRRAASAVRDGVRVLNEKETKNVFQNFGDGTELAHGTAYVDPNAKLPHDLDPTQKKTWKSVLGTTPVAKAIAQDGAGSTRELIDRKSAIAALQKTGKLKEVKAEAKAKKAPPDKYAIEQAKKAREAKRRHKVARLAFIELERKGRDAAGAPYWQWLATAVLRMIDEEDRRNLCKRRDIEAKSGHGDAQRELAKIVKETKTVDGLIGLVTEFASAYHAVGGLWAGKNFGDNFTEACDVLDVDLEKLNKLVVAEEKAKEKKPAKAKPAKKGGRK